MFSKFFQRTLFAIVFLSIALSSHYAEAKPAKLPKLLVFFSPSCHRCIEAKSKIIPAIEKEFSGRIELEYRDITDLENYKYLLALRGKYKGFQVIYASS